MKTIITRSIITIAASSFLVICVSCNKPTSGTNTSEYREGNSGATSETIKKDTPLDSSKAKE